MDNILSDKTLTCIDCGASFPFTAGEQSFYIGKKLSDPKRCKGCRTKKRALRDSAAIMPMPPEEDMGGGRDYGDNRPRIRYETKKKRW